MPMGGVWARPWDFPHKENDLAMNFSAIVTASWRRPQLFDTLRVLSQCLPLPQEILLHVDGGNHELAEEVRRGFPKVRLLEAAEKLGPGGSRNRLLAAAKNDWVASFDDDSHPVDPDFFARVEQVVRTQPAAAMIACHIYELGEALPEGTGECRGVTDFVGCGCIYRREVFMQTSGYVPLQYAYGMEEVDLSLRYLDMGHIIVFAPALRVIHNTDPENRNSPAAVAASIANIMLRAWLRYPLWLIPLGAAQCIHRLIWLFRHGYRAGLLDGLCSIPGLLQKNRHWRRTVRGASLCKYQFRRHQTNGIALLHYQ